MQTVTLVPPHRLVRRPAPSAHGSTARSPPSMPTSAAPRIRISSSSGAGPRWHRHLSEGQVDPPDRQPQAPPRALPLPLRHLQRPHSAGHADRRGLVRLDGGLRGLFRSMLGVPFYAVDAAPRTSPEKIAADRAPGRRMPSRRRRHAASMPRPRRSRRASAAYYIDQFTFAERATDWRGNNNIAESIFEQMSREDASGARAGSS